MVEFNIDLENVKINNELSNKKLKKQNKKSLINSKKIKKTYKDFKSDKKLENQLKKIKNKNYFNMKDYFYSFMEKNIECEYFSNLNFDKVTQDTHLLKAIEKMGFQKLTNIQNESYDKIFNRKNCVIKSETGSGKTMAYSLPLLQQLIKNDTKIERKDGIYMIIISPTRELCLQIYNFLLALCKGCINIVPGYLLGGEDVKKEKSRIRKGINILVATPGRLKYHLSHTQNLSLKNLKSIVFEECDRTLDFGFKSEILEIIEKAKEFIDFESLQLLLITATISKNIVNLISQIIDINKVEIVGFKNENLNKMIEENKNDFDEVYYNIPSTLTQFYMVLNERNRLTILIAILYILKDTKVIVFTSTADQANFLYKLIINLKWEFKHKLNQGNDTKIDTNVFKLHGYTDQKDRTKTFNEFNDCEKGILISTDVGCRGLDFKNVKTIILFDIPSDQNDYVNRIGRTARISENGISITFLIGNEEKFKDLLIKHYNIKELKAQLVYEHVFQYMNIKLEKDYDRSHTFFEYFIKVFIKQDDEIYYLSRRAFNSFCRAYGRIKDKENFSLKALFLNHLSRAYCLKSIKSKNDETQNEHYIIKDKRFYNSKKRDVDNPYKVNPNQVIYSEFL